MRIVEHGIIRADGCGCNTAPSVAAVSTNTASASYAATIKIGVPEVWSRILLASKECSKEVCCGVG